MPTDKDKDNNNSDKESPLPPPYSDKADLRANQKGRFDRQQTGAERELDRILSTCAHNYGSDFCELSMREKIRIALGMITFPTESNIDFYDKHLTKMPDVEIHRDNKGTLVLNFRTYELDWSFVQSSEVVYKLLIENPQPLTFGGIVSFSGQKAEELIQEIYTALVNILESEYAIALLFGEQKAKEYFGQNFEKLAQIDEHGLKHYAIGLFEDDVKTLPTQEKSTLLALDAYNPTLAEKLTSTARKTAVEQLANMIAEFNKQFLTGQHKQEGSCAKSPRITFTWSKQADLTLNIKTAPSSTDLSSYPLYPPTIRIIERASAVLTNNHSTFYKDYTITGTEHIKTLLTAFCQMYFETPAEAIGRLMQQAQNEAAPQPNVQENPPLGNNRSSLYKPNETTPLMGANNGNQDSCCTQCVLM